MFTFIVVIGGVMLTLLIAPLCGSDRPVARH